MKRVPKRSASIGLVRLSGGLVALLAFAVLLTMSSVSRVRAVPSAPSEDSGAKVAAPIPRTGPTDRRPRAFQPRIPMDTGGFADVVSHLRWREDASLADIRDAWATGPGRTREYLDRVMPPAGTNDALRLKVLLGKAATFNFEGDTEHAYELLTETRRWAEQHDRLADAGLYSVIFAQGVTALRRGETENCVMCRGESSCILPIAAAAVHTNPTGSRMAIRHFTEYLEQFPDDFAVRWLLNLAHMTLGEHPQKVDPRFLITLDHHLKSEFNIGKFRDIGHLVGVDRFNLAGGAVMEDFDNDGLLDLAVTAFDPVQPMGYYRNAGDGTFKDQSGSAGLIEQLGGKNLVQTDYDNDGLMDLFISRGAWFLFPMPQSLLKNLGNGKFRDVTRDAGLVIPVNSTASRWADYDNDGWLDLFVVCEGQSNLLYHNRGDGTFENVSKRAGVDQDYKLFCKGADWIDYDNDDYPDLFVNNLRGQGRLYHNNRDGTFTDVSSALGIDGPQQGFSCWAWDYDNDGWLDIFATCFDYSIEDVIKGLIGQPHARHSNRLFRNKGGKGFEDKTKECGLDLVFAAMGSNFGDLDNDGFLDFYLGTGDPDLSTLVPNRMFKNVGGHRFSEITASTGTGNLQKGHGISFADWDHDGDLDVFAEMGGAVIGDRYHNVLFQNPGQSNHWLTVKLIGKKTNRAAIGARLKVVAAGEPLTVHRHISSGSSWGANPLQQHVGLGKSERVAVLEIHWPTSGTTQVFRDIKADQAIEVTEFADSYRSLDWRPLPAPK